VAEFRINSFWRLQARENENKKKAREEKKKLAMYGRQPASFVLAIESINCPLIPKSHNLISPRSWSRILLGFTSLREMSEKKNGEKVSGLANYRLSITRVVILPMNNF